MTEVNFCALDVKCPYLKDKIYRCRYRYIDGCSFEYNSKLVKHGYRRFGRYFSKPICNGCDECKSMRIDAKNFKFTKSYRRIFKKNANTKVFITKPKVSDEHLNLYQKYHKFMHEKRGWDYHELDYRRYFSVYAASSEDFGYEVDYFVENKLVCVDLIDFVDDGISSIYCYYDPDYSYLSLGKFSLLVQIRLALQNSLDWIYLGFYVKGCESLEYKKEYTPYQILKEYCSIEESPVWEKVE